MKKGFTLLELLVVISIISMLSSIVLVNVGTARAKGRDSVRTQQIRQIGLATKMYIQDKGHAPNMGGACTAQLYGDGTDRTSYCFAISTAGIDARYDYDGPGGEDPQTPWQRFVSDIAPYMPGITDLQYPCGIECDGQGYVYIPPNTMVDFFCNTYYFDCPTSDDESMYDLYTNVETLDVLVGESFMGPLIVPYALRAAPCVLEGAMQLQWNKNLDNNIVGYNVYINDTLANFISSTYIGNGIFRSTPFIPQPNKQTAYRVRGYNISSTEVGPSSNTFNFTYTGCGGN